MLEFDAYLLIHGHSNGMFDLYIEQEQEQQQPSHHSIAAYIQFDALDMLGTRKSSIAIMP